MSAWRVGDEIGLFKGDEFYAMTPTREKAAELARWLNWVDLADGGTAFLAGLSDAQLRLVRHLVEMELGRRGVEVGRRQAEGGAEGDLAAPGAGAEGGAVGAVGAGDGGGCPPWCGGSAGG